MRAERSDSGRSAGRGYPSPRAGSSAPRSRAAERSDRRAPDDRSARHSGNGRPAVPDASRAGSSTAGRTRVATGTATGLRGAMAVVGIFLLTLAAAAADSYIGLGLGMITLVALTAGSVVAALVVRRRDLFSVVVAPPLVFIAVAFVNIGLAPSATLSLPTLATLLVRGFPAMGIATGAALVLAVFRLVTKR